MTWDTTEGKTTGVFISAFLPRRQFDDERFLRGEVKKAVDILVSEVPDIRRYDFIWVQVRSGFNIGIASFNLNRGFVFSTDGKRELESVPVWVLGHFN